LSGRWQRIFLIELDLGTIRESQTLWLARWAATGAALLDFIALAKQRAWFRM